MESIDAFAPHPPGRGLPPRLARARDERLARLIAAGNERAFSALYDRHAQSLYRYCRSIVGNEADAQDALQSALTAALVALRRGGRDAPLRPWLFRIAHNEAISLLRRRRPTVELSQVADPAAPSASEQAVERDRLRLLVGDLRQLGDRQRGALVMRELSGLSHDEIAIALEMSAGAAKQAIFEARRALADFAEGREMPCEEIRRILSDGDRRTLRGRRVHSHLRSCPSCAAFAAAIDDRREQLQALAPPLAPVAMAGVLAHLAGATGSSHGSAGVGALAGSAAGKSAAGVLATKALVGAALVTGATIGVTHAVRSGGRSHHSVRHITTRRAPSSHAASTQPVTGSTREPPQPTARPAPGATSAGSSAAAPAPASGKSTGHEQGVGRGRGHATDGAEPRGKRVARGHTRGPQANSKEARSRRLEHAGKARGTNGANSRHAKVTSKPGTRAGTPPQPSHQKPEVFGSSAGGRSKP